MAEGTEAVRIAVGSLVEAALASLQATEVSPRIGQAPDNQRWWRYGQETFVGLNPHAWLMTDTVTHYRWLEAMPQMRAVRSAFKAYPVLGPRTDNPLGTEWNRQPRQLGWLLVEHVIAPMVLAHGTYSFDQKLFNDAFDKFTDGLGAAEIRMVEFLPLNGFTSSEAAVELPDGLALQPMTDLQMSAAINHLAVPRMHGGMVNNAHVSRFHQWALTSTQSHPVVAGYAHVDAPTPPMFPLLTEPATRLVTALRIVCGGSVVTTRSMYAQADDEFPIVKGASAIMSAFDSADEQRPTVLTGNNVDEVLCVYSQLARPSIRADKQLQVAIRRLIFAGSRSLDSDRIVDLMTGAESLFVKRAGTIGASKGSPVAKAAARLLGGDDHLGASAAHVEAFMVEAYRARNAEIHGDGDPHSQLLLLSGTRTESMTLVVGDVERLMRRAISMILGAHPV